VFEGVSRMAEQFCDKWKAWPTCLKGLDERPSYFETYGGLGRRVWRGWMRSRHVLGLLEGLANVFEGVGREVDALWDLWRAWPTCLKGWMGGRRVMGLMEGLADVFEGVGWEAELFWDLSKAWLTCLKGLDERPRFFKTYGGLGRRVWRGWMRARRVLRVMEGFTDVFEGVGWETDVLFEVELFWDLWRAWPMCFKGWMGGRCVIGLMEGLADVFEGVGCEADVFYHLWYY